MTPIEDKYSELKRATGIEDWQVKYGFYTTDLLDVPKHCTTFIIVPDSHGYYYFVNVQNLKYKNYTKHYDVWVNPDWYAWSGSNNKGRGSKALGSRKEQLAKLKESVKQKQLLKKVLDKLQVST